MGRYFAAQGIRDVQSLIGGNPFLERFPFLVIVGPSGNFAQVHGPSGFAGRKPGESHELQAYEQTFNHKSVGWYKNEVICSFREGDLENTLAFGYAWQPYGQHPGDGAKINTTTFTPEINIDLDDYVMLDGVSWKQALEKPGNQFSSHYAFERVGGALHWIFSRNEGTIVSQGLYKGGTPEFVDLGAPGEGYIERGGILGARFNEKALRYVVGAIGKTGGLQQQAGIEYNQSSSFSNNFCDMIFHKGTMYVAKQYALLGIVPGAKGQFIVQDLGGGDAGISSAITGASDAQTYTSRTSINNFGGAKSRSFAKHKDEVYMLSNNGLVHTVGPAGLVQIADLSLLGTPWSSGILGGGLPINKSAGAGGWIGSTSHRCKLFSFNNQLHAFMNFSSSFRVAKGAKNGGATGRGVFWATSYDGVNWMDFSQRLPASGIIAPNGVASNTWASTTAPYCFSARNGNDATPYPSGFINGTIGAGDVPGEHNFPAQPSGSRQTGSLPFWTSGNMIDPANTPVSGLQIPLELGTISGCLFPTFVKYPEGFGYVSASGGFDGGQAPQGGDSNVWRPSGVGPSGYDYTNCTNYHVSAHVDRFDKIAHLFFTEDFDKGGTLYYTLNRASGFTLKNHAVESKQLNGFTSIDLYDPEIIIPSGDILNPNPRIDEVNKTATLNYSIYDWPFWDEVDVISEYSTDGKTWNFIGKSRQKATNTKELDPSGIVGQEHQLIWQYTKGPHPISKNVFYPYVQMRLRAERSL